MSDSLLNLLEVLNEVLEEQRIKKGSKQVGTFDIKTDTQADPEAEKKSKDFSLQKLKNLQDEIGIKEILDLFVNTERRFMDNKQQTQNANLGSAIKNIQSNLGLNNLNITNGEEILPALEKFFIIPEQFGNCKDLLSLSNKNLILASYGYILNTDFFTFSEGGMKNESLIANILGGQVIPPGTSPIDHILSVKGGGVFVQDIADILLNENLAVSLKTAQDISKIKGSRLNFLLSLGHNVEIANQKYISKIKNRDMIYLLFEKLKDGRHKISYRVPKSPEEIAAEISAEARFGSFDPETNTFILQDRPKGQLQDLLQPASESIEIDFTNKSEKLKDFKKVVGDDIYNTLLILNQYIIDVKNLVKQYAVNFKASNLEGLKAESQELSRIGVNTLYKCADDI